MYLNTPRFVAGVARALWPICVGTMLLCGTSCSRTAGGEDIRSKAELKRLSDENGKLKSDAEAASAKVIEMTATNQVLMAELQSLKKQNDNLSQSVAQANATLAQAQKSTSLRNYAKDMLDLVGKIDKGANSPRMLSSSVFSEAKTENEKAALMYPEHNNSTIYTNINALVEIGSELSQHRSSKDIASEGVASALKGVSSTLNRDKLGAELQRIKMDELIAEAAVVEKLEPKFVTLLAETKKQVDALVAKAKQ